MSSVHPKKGIVEVSCYLLTLIYIFWINRSDFWVEIFVGFALIEENMWIFYMGFRFFEQYVNFPLGVRVFGTKWNVGYFCGEMEFLLAAFEF